MESVLLMASEIATLIFSEVIKESGQQLGKAVSDKISQLLNLILEKFQKEGVEGKLTKAQEDPSDKNKNRFKQELSEQMEDDEAFAKKLKALMNELKLIEHVNEIFFKDVNVKGDVEIGDVEQTATRGGSVTQKVVTEVEVGGNLKIGKVKQQS